MIDLEKEKKAFVKVYTEIYGEHDQLWQGWKKRAELAQKENEDMQRQLKSMSTSNHNLLTKLAKYEAEQ